tara:strand:- start:97 stop:1206 length:1110 start_codon:yes stop_codon:yes gene_type:complete
MSDNNYQIYFDCGYSKLRVAAHNKVDSSKIFYTESNFFFDHTNIDLETQKIITYLEENTKEYINGVNIMIDSPKMLSIGISISKKIDGSKLKQQDIQFLVQEAKQQVSKNYNNQSIAHIIINNYKINEVDYDYLQTEINCKIISLDIIFICLPEETIEYFKNIFYKFDISINQIICTSYAKAINYKNNFSSNKNVTFIDVGFNKTSITSFVNNKIISLSALPIGGNHITKDISKLLKIDLKQAEQLKLDLDKNKAFLDDKNYSLELLQKIIFARTEEILEMSILCIKSNLMTESHYKMILMGDGSRILDNQYKDKISFANSIDFLDETIEDICQSGFKLAMGSNKQEVVVVPKKQIKQGFFEKLFHFFK